MLGAEVEHLLCLRDAAHHGAGEATTVCGERECSNFDRLLRQAQFDERAVDGEQGHVGVDIEIDRDRVEDQVELAAKSLERLTVIGRVVVIGAETKAVFLLAERLAQDGNFRAERLGDLHTDVTEAAEPDDGDLLAGACVPVPQR